MPSSRMRFYGLALLSGVCAFFVVSITLVFGRTSLTARAPIEYAWYQAPVIACHRWLGFLPSLVFFGTIGAWAGLGYFREHSERLAVKTLGTGILSLTLAGLLDLLSPIGDKTDPFFAKGGSVGARIGFGLESQVGWAGAVILLGAAALLSLYFAMGSPGRRQDDGTDEEPEEGREATSPGGAHAGERLGTVTMAPPASGGKGPRDADSSGEGVTVSPEESAALEDATGGGGSRPEEGGLEDVPAAAGEEVPPGEGTAPPQPARAPDDRGPSGGGEPLSPPGVLHLDYETLVREEEGQSPGAGGDEGPAGAGTGSRPAERREEWAQREIPSPPETGIRRGSESPPPSGGEEAIPSRPPGPQGEARPSGSSGSDDRSETPRGEEGRSEDAKEAIPPRRTEGYPRDYWQAVQIVRETGRASEILLQRRLGIGYVEATRLLDRMEEEGVVTPPRQSGFREVLPPPRGEA